MDDDAFGWDFGYFHSVIYKCHAVSNQAGFGRSARRAAEAAIVDSQDMNVFWVGGGEGAVGVWAVALGYCASIAVDWWEEVSKVEGQRGSDRREGLRERE